MTSIGWRGAAFRLALAALTVSAVGLGADAAGKKFETAKLTSRPHIAYPPEELARASKGAVHLKIQVLADGSVGEVKISRSSDIAAFDAAAREAAAHWKYSPSHAPDGNAVMSYDQREVRFDPRDAVEWQRLARIYRAYHAAIRTNENVLASCSAAGFRNEAARAAVKIDAETRQRAQRLEARLVAELAQQGSPDAQRQVDGAIAKSNAAVDQSIQADFVGRTRDDVAQRCKATLDNMLIFGPFVPDLDELLEF